MLGTDVSGINASCVDCKVVTEFMSNQVADALAMLCVPGSCSVQAANADTNNLHVSSVSTIKRTHMINGEPEATFCLV